MYPPVREVAAKIRGERTGFREILLQNAGARRELLLLKIEGQNIFGLDESGKQVLTKEPEALRLRILKNNRVRIRFRRESVKRVEGMNVERLEERLRMGWRAPRKMVSFSADLFHAVRSLKHVREAHAQEFEKTDELLQQIEKINLEFALREKKLSAEQASKLRSELVALCEELEQKTSSLKIMALQKLRDAIALLYARRVANACAKMVAFRRRLGKLRDEQVIGIDDWNYLREASLRVARDQLLIRQLTFFEEVFSNPQRANGYLRFIERDRRLIERLQKLRENIEGKEKSRESLLGEIAVNGKIFKKEGKGKDFAVQRLRKAWKAINAKPMRRAEALMQIDEAICFIRQNKLNYMAEELEATNDAYLQQAEIIERMTTAHNLFMQLEFDEAVEEIRVAKERLQKFQPR